LFLKKTIILHNGELHYDQLVLQLVLKPVILGEKEKCDSMKLNDAIEMRNTILESSHL
jgi:NADH dehydrogenase FAD-containing subunit